VAAYFDRQAQPACAADRQAAPEMVACKHCGFELFTRERMGM
jgi:hypothetical protein